ncbi:MAG: alpha/beta hydrolase [Caldilineaceae bacterium]|nr:alpha/beta hydrolase [Caldilineaceae bacterium]
MIVFPWRRNRHWIERRSSACGLSIFARISSEGNSSSQPIVLVHGLSMSGRYLLPTAKALSSARPVYVPDLPGFGKSAKPDHVLTIPQLADVLAAWIATQKLNRAAFLGNSFGCQVIVEFALRYPERISHAILTGPSVDPAARSAFRQILRLFFDALLFEPLPLYAVALLDYSIAGPWRTLQTLDHLINDPIERKLPQVKIPALVVRGSQDLIVPQSWAEDAARSLPRGQLVVLNGEGHAVNFSAPARLAQIVNTFLGD